MPTEPTPPWRLTTAKPDEADRAAWTRRLPTAAAMRAGGAPTLEPASAPDPADPANYLADEALIDAINTALLLGQPLLITGEPGCGKTEAANFLAYRLGLERPSPQDGVEYALRFDTKSTTTARDLFYGFDVVSRFYAAQNGGDPAPEKHITLNALGRAIAAASDNPIAARLRLDASPAEPSRSVVLIDEVDKAPRDVPNDLLVELERLQFYIAEMDVTISARRDLQPIVVLTSNSERVLPDAFLRRCVFLSLPFPRDDLLVDIVMARVAAYKRSRPAAMRLVTMFTKLRNSRLSRRPGTAELLSFAHILADLGAPDPADLKGERNWHQAARVTLLKNVEDQARADARLLNGLLA